MPHPNSTQSAPPTAVAVMLGLFALVACGGSSNATREYVYPTKPSGPPELLQVEQPFFTPGETMAWELSLRGLVGGTSMLAVGQPGVFEDQNVVVVRSRTESAGLVKLIKDVRDEVTTWVNLETSHPAYHKADLKFGDKESLVESRFGTGPFEVIFQRKGRAVNKLTQMLPEAIAAHDTHSAIGLIRAWQPQAGARAYFYSMAGRRMWKNVVRFSGRQSLRTQTGIHPVIRLDGIATRLNKSLQVETHKKPRSYTVYITDDADRVPVLITAHTEYGDVKMELTGYERPPRHFVRR